MERKLLKAERSVCVFHQLSRVQTCREDRRSQESLVGRGCSMRGCTGEEVIQEWGLPRTSHGNTFEDPQEGAVIIRVTSQSNNCNKLIERIKCLDMKQWASLWHFYTRLLCAFLTFTPHTHMTFSCVCIMYMYCACRSHFL